jgi:hypothetical protein
LGASADRVGAVLRLLRQAGFVQAPSKGDPGRSVAAQSLGGGGGVQREAERQRRRIRPCVRLPEQLRTGDGPCRHQRRFRRGSRRSWAASPPGTRMRSAQSSSSTASGQRGHLRQPGTVPPVLGQTARCRGRRGAGGASEACSATESAPASVEASALSAGQDSSLARGDERGAGLRGTAGDRPGQVRTRRHAGAVRTDTDDSIQPRTRSTSASWGLESAVLGITRHGFQAMDGLFPVRLLCNSKGTTWSGANGSNPGSLPSPYPM